MFTIPTLDEFKRMGTPQYFGLGFLQLKVNAHTRYHFWHPHLVTTVDAEEIHDHRYDFTSHILKGLLVNDLYAFTPDPDGQWERSYVSCDPTDPIDPATFEPERGIARLTGIFHMPEGSHYIFKAKEFHRTHTGMAITRVERGPVTERFAQVVRPVGATPVCPFEKKMSEDEVWEIIADLL